MYTLSPEKKLAVIASLLEGNSVRSTERMTGVHRDTICRLLVQTGNRCASLWDENVRNIRVRYVQADEIWTYVGKKDKHVRVDDPDEFGNQWVFVALAQIRTLPVAMQPTNGVSGPPHSEYDELRCGGILGRFARTSMSDDLSSLKDDMNAFILGHGLSRFQGYVTEEVHSVMWDPRDNPESWKDFVELAKKAGAEFLSMDEEVLQRDELDYLIQRLQHTAFPSDDDMEEARWLRNYIGKTGFIQLGWPHQGIMFLFEASTEWYERYQHLLDMVEDFGSMAIGDADQDDER